MFYSKVSIKGKTEEKHGKSFFTIKWLNTSVQVACFFSVSLIIYYVGGANVKIKKKCSLNFMSPAKF